MPNYALGNIGDQPIKQVYKLTKASIVFQVLIGYSDVYICQGTLKGEVSLYH
jgi:hypothetical protein